MSDRSPQPMRVEDRIVTDYLDRLDRKVNRTPRRDSRVDERFSYRARPLTLETIDAEDETTPHAVAARNLSAGGIGVLAGRFVYPGTRCRMTLRSLYNRDDVVLGRVARCRYLVGSASLYEIGVQFRRPVDVGLFAAGANLVRLLLVDESPRMHNLVASFLGSTNVDLICATSALDAAAAALQREFDLILLDLESQSFDAFLVTRELRRGGYLGPIVGLAVQTGPPLREKCAQAGCTGYLSKPLTRAALRGVLDSLNTEPLLSSLAGDASMEPLINEFVLGLPDLAREMSAAFENGDLETVREVARALRADAGSYGFEAITREASQVQTLATLEATPSSLRPALYELIHLCLAARPATPGGTAPFREA